MVHMQYTLDLETLLALLGGRKQSGELSTEIGRFPGRRGNGPYHARIILVEGKVNTCLVVAENGWVLADGEEALRGLQAIGELDWSWQATNQGSTPTTPENPADSSSLIPRLLIPLNKVGRNTLPRRCWQVLLLVDGSRSIAQIAHLLALTPPEELEVWQLLQTRGIVMVAPERMLQ
jgi:hypothetical protein